MTGPLAELMGRTRAAALNPLSRAAVRRVRSPVGFGISNARASQHTSVLRRSGLITTVSPTAPRSYTTARCLALRKNLFSVDLTM